VAVVDLLVERCAGLDVAKREVVACVRTPGPGAGGRRRQEIRTFPTFSADLEALADWLAAEGVTHVVLEATGVYWRPVVRHEVPRVRVEVKGLRQRSVAVGR
jgi:transposase